MEVAGEGQDEEFNASSFGLDEDANTDGNNKEVDGNKSIEQQCRELENQIRAVRGRRKCLDDMNQQIVQQIDRLEIHRNRAEKKLADTIAERDSMRLRHDSAQHWLQLTRRMNPLNDAFHIWHHGSFGTINGLRLGSEVSPLPLNSEEVTAQIVTPAKKKPTSSPSSLVAAASYMGFFSTPSTSGGGDSNTVMSSTSSSSKGSNSNSKGSSATTTPSPSKLYIRQNTTKVPWSEINAALGMSALLLCTLEERRDSPIRFRSYRIIPMGSYSKIVHNNTTYNLFSDDGFSIFGKRNFNSALLGLLHCLADGAKAARNVDGAMAVPHIIDAGKGLIGGLPFAYSPTDAGRWTTALKYFLIDLKWLMAFHVKHVDR